MYKIHSRTLALNVAITVGAGVLPMAAGCNQSIQGQPSQAQSAGKNNTGALKATPSSQPLQADDTAANELAVTDSAIEAAIQRELFAGAAIDNSEVTVTVDEGIAVMTGDVDNLLARERAQRLAAIVRGVRSISNRVTVTPTARSDAELVRDIEAALKTDSATDHLSIEVNVANQQATLTGPVDSFVEKEVAERVVKGIRGVREVSNQLNVTYDQVRTDNEIDADVRASLYWDALIDEHLISVNIDRGHVTLDGTVGSLAEKYRAQDKAWVAGVRGVNVQPLAVHWSVSDTNVRDPKQSIKSDSEIAAAIRDAVSRDPRVDSGDVRVMVKSGEITLSGTVSDLRARQVAAEIASNTTGARGVQNQLRVSSPTPTAAASLERKIEAALMRNAITEAFEIDVEVTLTGAATLTGAVTTYAEKAEAEDVVSAVPGVISVSNELQVQHPVAFVRSPYVFP